MQKFIYPCCILLSVSATLYMGYTCYIGVIKDYSIMGIAVRIVATIAWAIVTYRIITKQDKWFKKSGK